MLIYPSKIGIMLNIQLFYAFYLIYGLCFLLILYGKTGFLMSPINNLLESPIIWIFPNITNDGSVGVFPIIVLKINLVMTVL